MTNNKPRVRVIVIIVASVVVGSSLVWLLRPKNTAVAPPKPTTTLKTPIVRANLVATGFQATTAIVSTGQAGDTRLFIVERPGSIRSVDTTKSPEAQAFLDITGKVYDNSQEMGLLGLAFHPKFNENGYFYVNYIDKNQNTVIARYTASADAKVDTASEKVLFTLKQPYPNHNGGDLVFGPDGYLYVALGDGGSAGDPENRAQNKDSYFGKLLRIDVNSGDPYAVPPTNPFVNKSGNKPEIWAYGLRNPWRISFDKQTGDLYIADVGQGKLEEVNFQKHDSKGGENYGWRCLEADEQFIATNCQDAASFIAPVLVYDHTEKRCSITGGYVYRGQQNPALAGKYFYGDFCGGQIYYGSEVDGHWQQVQAAQTPYMISTFGQGNDGELYLADIKTGSIYKLQDVNN